MKAIILCAGYATRLYPLTLDKPKALLPIHDRALLDYTIDKLPENIKEIIIVSNDKYYENFLSWATKYGNRMKVLNDETTSNETRLGGIGDLWFAIEKEKVDDDILVLCGDNLFDFDLADFINFFEKHNKSAVFLFLFFSCNYVEFQL